MPSTAPDILAVGLNPVRQITLVFPSFQPGQVNRATTRLLAAGGKGAHAARAANTICPQSCAVAQFLGGDTGAYVAAALDHLEIPQWTVSIRGETRGCITVLDEAAATMTELVEPSPGIEAEAIGKLLKRLAEELPKLKAVSLCGTFPPGCGPEAYADIARRCDPAWLLLDAWRNVDQTLETGQVDVLKVNAHELREMTGCDQLVAAAATCRRRFRVPWIAVTDGPETARLFGPDEAWVCRLPRLERVVNPLGAGDTVTGVMMRKLADGSSVPDAFADGLAAATASCKHRIGAEFTLAEMQECRKQLSMSTA